MSLKNILKEKLIHCSLDASVQEVANLMKDEDIGAVVILDGEKCVGIVTDRDLALRCICDGLPAETTRARDAMTAHVVTVSLDEGVAEVITKMRKSEIRRVVIVDGAGKPVGLVSFGDVLQLLVSELTALASPAAPEDVKIRTTERSAKPRNKKGTEA